jgi:hypothetical protein
VTRRVPTLNRGRLPGALVAAGLILVAAGCGKREAPAERPHGREPVAEAPAPTAEPPFDPIGTWTVVGHSMPGITATTEGEAQAHDGQTVQFSPTEALSNGERCAEPRYPARAVDTEGFLATEFNLPPESLKPVAGKDLVTVVEVSCADAPWTAFGSLLIVVGANRVITPWDGVFFELERTPKPRG